MALGKSAKYYASNPLARAKKLAYDKKYQKKPSAVRKRVECNKWNRRNGTYGNGDQMDCSHRNGNLISEHRKANRARGGAERR
jgi:hypothetical protein